MALVDPDDLASRDEIDRRENAARTSGDFFDTNRDALVQKVEAEINNGTDLGNSFNRNAENLGELGVANNPRALAEAVVDSWQQSATQEADWGAYRDAQDILNGRNTEDADMNINSALKHRGSQLYEAQQSEPGELHLSEAQKQAIRDDLNNAPRAQGLTAEENQQLWAEVNAEVAQIRAERATQSTGDRADAIPSTQDVLRQEQAIYQQNVASGVIPASMEQVFDETRLPSTGAAAPTAAVGATALWGDDGPALAAVSTAPSPSPFPATKPNEAGASYKIQEGDTLHQIAENNLRQNGQAVTAASVRDEVDRLAEINGIQDKDMIIAGDDMNLGGQGQKQPTAAPEPAVAMNVPPPPAPETPEQIAEREQQQRYAKVDKALDKVSSVAAIFGFGGMAEVLKVAVEQSRESIPKDTAQGVQIADGTSVTPLQTPGGRQRVQEMAV